MKKHKNIINKGQRYGLWITYYSNGPIWYKGYFIDDIIHGYWIYNNQYKYFKSRITFNIE